MISNPLVSIIVPVKNGAETLQRCLEHITQSNYRNFELIVVDDGSSDESAAIAFAFTTQVYRPSNDRHPNELAGDNPVCIGPAGARNFGSNQAKGEILFFVDSDVLIGSDALERAVQFLSEDQKYVAIFGCYDTSPAAKGLVSQFRNLLHHFVHQTSNAEASTFWAGCGAIRREAFHQIDGFNTKDFPLPSVEDIDLGYRLRDAGLRIFLDKSLTAKHLKCWTLTSMVITDIFYRAIPWLRLLNNRPTIFHDLNLQTTSRLSGGLIVSAVFILTLLSGVGILKFSGIYREPIILRGYSLEHLLLFLSISTLTIAIVLNLKLYNFLAKNNGIVFAIRAIPIHFLYYFYSSLTFVLFHIGNKLLLPTIENK